MRLNSIITWYKPYKTKNKKQNKTKLNVNPFKKKKKVEVKSFGLYTLIRTYRIIILLKYKYI